MSNLPFEPETFEFDFEDEARSRGAARGSGGSRMQATSRRQSMPRQAATSRRQMPSRTQSQRSRPSPSGSQAAFRSRSTGANDPCLARRVLLRSGQQGRAGSTQGTGRLRPAKEVWKHPPASSVLAALASLLLRVRRLGARFGNDSRDSRATGGARLLRPGDRCARAGYSPGGPPLSKVRRACP